MSDALDDIMERASNALVRMDYLTCEACCLEALAEARASNQWTYYARVLLPLQEARRQRRMIAAEGVIRLGTAEIAPPDRWLASLNAGCIVITHPYTADDARAFDARVRNERKHVEILFADNSASAPAWRLRSFNGPAVTCLLDAPPESWQDTWLAPGDTPSVDEEQASTLASRTPADWFLDASEALGDAALEQVTARTGSLERIEQLENMLHVVTDHEILHQRLGDAARAMQ